MEEFVQVISREIMKPSSETGLHPQKLELSYLDQMLWPIYIPFIFFYKGDESRGLTSSNHSQISQRLKHSLLQIMPSFYPLAGRLKNGSSVDCNDAGFEFVETRARARLDDDAVLNDDERLKVYVPRECATDYHGKRAPLLVVQITFFDCGGIVIGACGGLPRCLGGRLPRGNGNCSPQLQHRRLFPSPRAPPLDEVSPTIFFCPNLDVSTVSRIIISISFMYYF